MKLLFDTNVWIAIQRGVEEIRTRWKQQDPNDIFLCSRVLAELRIGALASQRKRQNMLFVDDITLQHDCLNFGIQEAARFADLYDAMVRSSQTVKTMDLQIASVASVHGLRVVTHDIADFGRIPGIDIEDWQA
jgi:tRNA(fMet)-specific endonuclease VapC